MSITAAQRIWRALDDLEKLLIEYKDDGDWHGCIRNALPYLRESLRSDPPGFGRVPDEEYRVDNFKVWYPFASQNKSLIFGTLSPVPILLKDIIQADQKKAVEVASG